MLSWRPILACMILMIAALFFLSSCERPINVVDQGVVEGAPQDEEPDFDANTEIGKNPALDLDQATVDSQGLIFQGGIGGMERNIAEDTPDNTASPSLTRTGDGAGLTVTGAANRSEATVIPEVTPAAGQPPVENQITPPASGIAIKDGAGPGDSSSDRDPAAIGSTQELTHTVASGETLYRIGLAYGHSWLTLARINNIQFPDYIYPGQVLLIPAPGPAGSIFEAVRGTFYTVNPGDSLLAIAELFGVSWIEIAEANGILNANQIYPGQTLKIPTHTPGISPEFTHEVRAGQTLYSISLIYGVPVLSIAKANGLTTPYVIYEGQILVIPGG